MREKTRKLFRVTLRGMTGYSSGVIHGVNYVIANDPTEAYESVRRYLDEKDIGFNKERELDNIELIAESSNCPECQTMLFCK